MATQPHPQPKPPTPPPAPPPKPQTPAARTEGGITQSTGAVPPKWEEPKQAEPAPPAWTPKPDLNPQDEKPPQGVYADGMDAATEQRARSEWIEGRGMQKYREEVFEGDKADQPKFDKDALAGGGAYVSAGKQQQVPGLVPPTKRS